MSSCDYQAIKTLSYWEALRATSGGLSTNIWDFITRELYVRMTNNKGALALPFFGIVL